MNQALPVVYLVRHADTEWTLADQHAGRTDLALTEQGERQARALGTSLTALRINRMHASVEADGELMEWDYGACEGRRTVEIEVERPGWRLFRNGCPGGETLDSVGKRADRVIGRIRSEGGIVVLFGHIEPVIHAWNGRVTAAASAR